MKILSLLLIILIYCPIKSTRASEHRSPKSLNEIKNQKFSDEEIFEFFMYGEAAQFNDAVDSDQVYRHLIIKNGDLPFDSIIGNRTGKVNDKKQNSDYYELDNELENDLERQTNELHVRSSKTITQLYTDQKIKFFNYKNKALEAKRYINDLSKIDFSELSAILRAVLVYIRTPSRKYLDITKFMIQTVKKIFKQLELHTVLFEIENGIYTRVSCVLCMTFFNIFRSPIFYPFSTERIVNLICLLKLSNPHICNQMADNFSKTFGYIRINSQLTVEETCGTLIGTQCLVEQTEKLNWTVKLPPLLNKNYRNLVDVTQTSTSLPVTNQQQQTASFKDAGEEKTFYIGHLTDVHIDPFYLDFSNASCFEPICCRKQVLNRTIFGNILKQFSSNEHLLFHLPFGNKNNTFVTKDTNFFNNTISSLLPNQELKNITLNLHNLTLNIGKKMFEIASISGIFGDYNDCDTPPITFGLVLDAIKKFKINDFSTIDLDGNDNNQPRTRSFDSELINQLNQLNNTPNLDYVLWTGDILPHDFWSQTKKTSIKYIEESTNSIHKYLPTTPIIPVLGNHETVPINSFAPDFSDLDGADYELDLNRYFFNETSKQMQLNLTNQNKERPKRKSIEIDPDLTSEWLYKAAAKSWKIWLPDSALKTARRTGNYVLNKNKNFRLIIINTNYCARINFWSWYDSVDPGNQLKFLIHELFEAENQNQYVHIIGHIAPDHLECTQAWLDNYLKILHRFKHVIRSQFFGHTHRDEHRVYYSTMDFQNKLMDDYGFKNSGLESLFERDQVKIGPIKPSPTHTPVSSATSSTFSKIKKGFVKIRNGIKKKVFNWRSSSKKELESVNKIKRKLNDLLLTGNSGSSSNDALNSNVAAVKANEENEKTIAAQKDDLHVAVSFAFISPSVTSYSKTNPAYRIFAVGEETGRILDYNTFFFNLTEAKLQSFKGTVYEPTWKLEYSSREEYKDYLSRDQGRFTEYAFHLLQDKLIQDEETFFKFYRKFYVQSDAKDALSFDQTVRNMVLQNTMVRDPYKVWPTKFDELFAY